MFNPAKLEEAIELLNLADLAIQSSGIDDDVCYDLHNIIEDLISEIEVDTYHAWDCAGEEA